MIDTREFSDELSRFVFERAAVRGAVVSVDATCRDILACHPYPPALQRALAELLAAAALLASALKFKGSLIVQLQGDGPVQLLVVECDATLALRATAKWRDDASTLAADAQLATLAGDTTQARLAITLDPKDGGPLYQGIVGLEASSIAALIQHYLTSSEQIDSRMALAIAGNRVRGLLLQRLPSAGPEDDATWQRAAARADAIAPCNLIAATSPESLLLTAFPDEEVRLFKPQPTQFSCGCSEERIANALRLLGRGEVEGILVEQGMIGVTCEFCNRHYTFLAEDARALFARETAAADARGDGPLPTIRH